MDLMEVNWSISNSIKINHLSIKSFMEVMSNTKQNAGWWMFTLRQIAST